MRLVEQPDLVKAILACGGVGAAEEIDLVGRHLVIDGVTYQIALTPIDAPAPAAVAARPPGQQKATKGRARRPAH